MFFLIRGELVEVSDLGVLGGSTAAAAAVVLVPDSESIGCAVAATFSFSILVIGLLGEFSF